MTVCDYKSDIIWSARTYLQPLQHIRRTEVVLNWQVDPPILTVDKDAHAVVEAAVLNKALEM